MTMFPERPAPCAFRRGRLLALATGLLCWQAWAQSGSASFQLPRQGVDGGAVSASSSGFRLRGTLGQPEAGNLAMAPSWQLQGGFHQRIPTTPGGEELFADGFE